jgi:hypothetical protein
MGVFMVSVLDRSVRAVSVPSETGDRKAGPSERKQLCGERWMCLCGKGCTGVCVCVVRDLVGPRQVNTKHFSQQKALARGGVRPMHHVYVLDILCVWGCKIDRGHGFTPTLTPPPP